jgi:hypothetical protein
VPHLAHFIVALVHEAKQSGRIEDAIIDTRVGQSLRKQVGQHGGDPVQGVGAGRHAPEYAAHILEAARTDARLVRAGHIGPGHLFDVIEDGRRRLHQMAVAVNDRVADHFSNFRCPCGGTDFGVHDFLPYDCRRL